MADSPSNDCISTEHVQPSIAVSPCSPDPSQQKSPPQNSAPPILQSNKRQQSWELLDPSALSVARLQKNNSITQSQLIGPPKGWTSLDFDGNPKTPLSNMRSNSMPTPSTKKVLPTPKSVMAISRSGRGSVSNENNVLLDPDVLTDQATQALVLTVLATLVRSTTDENETRILYEYLAEASVVFAKVFPVIHGLLDAKIINVLNLCHDQVILNAVQSIIQNMIASEDNLTLAYLQTIGFGGLWRFAGPFTKPSQNNDNAELFVNYLEVLVETYLPGDDPDVHNPYPSSLGITSNLNLSSSMSSLSVGSLHSPTDKDGGADHQTAMNGRLRHGSANTAAKTRSGSFKRNNSKKKMYEVYETST